MTDVHCALLRLTEGAECEASTLAQFGAAAELAPRDAYRCLLVAYAGFAYAAVMPLPLSASCHGWRAFVGLPGCTLLHYHHSPLHARWWKPIHRSWRTVQRLSACCGQ